ncbi:MAG: G-D-S-L family lipolytic protein, partial [Chryseobacterium sp.]
MKKYIVTSFAAAALLMTGSCDTDFENDVLDVVPTAGSADFSRYVAIGNSLTSGYRDNALYLDGQQESFPSMIAQGMKQAGGGDFKQPLMPNNIGGFTGL